MLNDNLMNTGMSDCILLMRLTCFLRGPLEMISHMYDFKLDMAGLDISWLGYIHLWIMDFVCLDFMDILLAYPIF